MHTRKIKIAWHMSYIHKSRQCNSLSSNLCIPLKSCIRLIITFSDTNYKLRDGFLCRPRRARKYICPAIARYLLAADIRFVLSPANWAIAGGAPRVGQSVGGVATSVDASFSLVAFFTAIFNNTPGPNRMLYSVFFVNCIIRWPLLP